MSARSTRGGHTLLELIIVIAILGMAALVAGVSPRASESAGRVGAREAGDSLDLTLKSIRAEAVTSGHPVSRNILWSGEAADVTAFPDGRIMATPSPVPKSPETDR